MKLLADVTSASISNNNIMIYFETVNIRYYKLVATDTSATGTKYIAFRYIEFSYNLGEGDLIGVDELGYYNNWSVESAPSTFGHIYVSKDGYMEFTFTGRYFAVFSYLNESFEGFSVYIDGKWVKDVSMQGGGTSLVYLSSRLSQGEHTIRIEGKNFNIDSVVTWKD